MRFARTIGSVLCLSALAASPCMGQAAWRLVEDFRLGASSDGPDSFDGIVSMAVAKNGNIFVVDAKPLQVKLFSPTGKFLRNVGRTGQGPSEYSDIGAIALDFQGNIQIIAPNSGRVLVFSPNGELLRQTTVTFDRFPGRWEGTLSPDGSLLDPIDVRLPNRTATTRETRMALQRIKPNGVRADTLLFPGCAPQHTPTVQYLRIPTSKDSYFSMRVPFLADPQTVFANDGTAWCAPGDTYAVYHFRVGRSETLHVARLNVPAPPLTEAERAALTRTKARAWNGSDLELPKVKPTLRSIRIDDSKRLWVRRTATPDAAPSFDVFDSQARLLATVKTNLRWVTIPLIVGDTAYGPVLGDDDVPLFVRAHIRR